MDKNKDVINIIQSDSSGKLYIKGPEFFSQPKVQ